MSFLQDGPQAVLGSHLQQNEITISDNSQKGKNVTEGWSGSNSLPALISALIPSLAVAVLLTGTFLVLRRYNKRVYLPRTYLGSIPEEERTPAPSNTWFLWMRKDFWGLPDNYVLNHHRSLEAYLFLRFFKVIIALGIGGILLSWPIILPINATGGRNLVQFDKFLIGNVESKNKLYAHALVSCLFLAFVMIVITRETMIYINLRLAFQSSARHKSKISSKVVLFTSVPHDMRNEAAIKEALHGVRRVWILGDVKKIKELAKERDEIAMKLETAQNKLSQKANKLHQKEKRRGTLEAADVEVGMADTGKYDKERPSHRLFPLVGDKVDTIDWARQHVEELSPKLEEARRTYLTGQGTAKCPDAFVEFESLAAAQTAYNNAFKHSLSALDLRYMDITPDQIVWDNIGIGFSQRRLRRIMTTTAVVLLIIFWSIPVAAIGSISNVHYLTKKLPFLKFVEDLPTPVLGVVTGLLPQLLLSVLMSLVPIICRFIASLDGDISLTGIEMKTQSWYFAFSVIQVFLVTTISSGVSSAIQEIIQNPKTAADILARDLPKGSNFYTSYMVLYGLANASKAILNIGDFFMIAVVGRFLDRTPRDLYQRRAAVRKLSYGSTYPKFTNLSVIAISYSCIAPIVLGFATCGLSLLYLAFRYNLMYAFESRVDTGGHMYNRALQQLIVGVFISELCLIGIFSLRKAFGPLVIMVIFLGLTTLYHTSMNLALGNLTKSVPTFPMDADDDLPPEESRDHKTDNLFLCFDERLGKFADPMPMDQGGDSLPVLLRPSSPKFLARIFNAHLFRVPSMEYLRDSVLDAHFGKPVSPYTAEQERDAYHHPEVSSKTPKLWIARDSAGVSSREVEQNKGAIEATDEKAHLDEKSRIVWDKDRIEDAPVFKPTKYY